MYKMTSLHIYIYSWIEDFERLSGFQHFMFQNGLGKSFASLLQFVGLQYSTVKEQKAKPCQRVF